MAVKPFSYEQSSQGTHMVKLKVALDPVAALKTSSEQRTRFWEGAGLRYDRVVSGETTYPDPLLPNVVFYSIFKQTRTAQQRELQSP